MLPGVVKSYAPRGDRFTIQVPLKWDHLSVIGAVNPNGGMSVSIHEQTINGWDVILFVTHLLKHFSDRLLVIWDGGPIHRSEIVKLFIHQVGPWHLKTEFFPPYAPDLNPTEGLWHQLKHGEMPNLACTNIVELKIQLRLAIMRLRMKPRLIQSFFGQPQLDISEFQNV